MLEGSAPPTIRDCVIDAAARLVSAGIPRNEASLDAELLARHELGWDRARYLVDRGTPAPEGFLESYSRQIARRAGREPVHLILGYREFWGREFSITRDVLSPRPETELIVETALELAWTEGPPAHTADVGTGSGCLAITLALEIPETSVFAFDLSAKALDIARRNAVRHGVDGRVQFMRGDHLLDARGGFDLIVSNPPYVALSARDTLPPEVRDYEPALALYGGIDGFSSIRAVMAQAPGRLRPGGWLLMEIGAGQHVTVRQLAAASTGLNLVSFREDLQGIPRVAAFRSRRRAEG